MDVTWLVDEYLGNGKVRHAAFSSKRRAVEVAERSCDHSSKVILVEWTYCRPLSVQQLFPVRTDPVVYESSSVFIRRCNLLIVQIVPSFMFLHSIMVS